MEQQKLSRYFVVCFGEWISKIFSPHRIDNLSVDFVAVVEGEQMIHCTFTPASLFDPPQTLKFLAQTLDGIVKQSQAVAGRVQAYIKTRLIQAEVKGQPIIDVHHTKTFRTAAGFVAGLEVSITFTPLVPLRPLKESTHNIIHTFSDFFSEYHLIREGCRVEEGLFVGLAAQMIAETLARMLFEAAMANPPVLPDKRAERYDSLQAQIKAHEAKLQELRQQMKALGSPEGCAGEDDGQYCSQSFWLEADGKIPDGWTVDFCGDGCCTKFYCPEHAR